MKIREITNENVELSEAMFPTAFVRFLGPLWILFSAATLIEPIYRTWKKISAAQGYHDRGDPRWSDAALDAYKVQEMGWLSANLAARIIGNRLIKSLGWITKAATLFNSPVARVVSSLTTAAQAALMGFLVSPDGAKFIGEWLAGELFLDGKQVPGGKTWEQVIGGVTKGAVDLGKDVVTTVTGTDDQAAPKAREVPATSPAPVQKPAEKPKYTGTDLPVYTQYSGLVRNPVTGELEISKQR